MPDRISMVDVAREAGVSVMTVSRAIRGKDNVSPETRARVLKVAERLGYRPNIVARGLVTNTTGTLGLVMPDVSNPFFSDVARGAEDEAYAQGYGLVLCNTSEEVKRELAQIRLLEDRRVDGLIICSSRMDDRTLRMTLEGHARVVLLNRRLPGTRTGAILVDNVTGAVMITQHLVALGHTHIGFVAGPYFSRGGRERAQGYHMVLEEHSLPPRADWEPECPPTIAGGEGAATMLLERYPEISALFCYNDLTAVGALQAAQHLGRAVPADLSIAGFDGIPLAGLVTPPLTTCEVNTHELGAQAMRLLLAQIADDPRGYHEITIKPDLVIRESTAACPSRSDVHS